MKHQPHAFQRAGIDHAVQFFRTAGPGDRQSYASPTGTGKSVVELYVQDESAQGIWIVTPRDEIIVGLLDKLGSNADPIHHHISTPIKLRNALLRGDVKTPTGLIYDEGHHHNAETWQQLDLLTGRAPTLSYTATPYRGSPRGTKEFREAWGEALWLITLEEAVAEGFIKLPTFTILPLVDDDIVDVRGGEFDVTSIDAATVDRLGDLADHSVSWHRDGFWDKPTIYAMPSTESCRRLQNELSARQLPAVIVSGETPRRERQELFAAVEQRLFALLHINIVTEGVDLQLRRLVDVAPTLSPVKWVQQLGRIERPGSGQPEYVGCNRNLLRHAYVLEGAVPEGAMVEAEKQFPRTERAHSRVLGLEAIGRFKPTTAKLQSGLTLHVYALSVPAGPVVVEYCALVHPTRDPVWASKVNTVVDGVKKWGSWRACDPPDDLRGFSSVAPSELSDKQRQWWRRAAYRHGLDPDQEVTRKSFQALPVLSDLGVRL